MPRRTFDVRYSLKVAFSGSEFATRDVKKYLKTQIKGSYFFEKTKKNKKGRPRSFRTDVNSIEDFNYLLNNEISLKGVVLRISSFGQEITKRTIPNYINCRRAVVDNVPATSNDSQLKELFSRFGKVKEIFREVLPPETSEPSSKSLKQVGPSSGVRIRAFVQFASEENAKKCLESEDLFWKEYGVELKLSKISNQSTVAFKISPKVFEDNQENVDPGPLQMNPGSNALFSGKLQALNRPCGRSNGQGGSGGNQDFHLPFVSIERSERPGEASEPEKDWMDESITEKFKISKIGGLQRPIYSHPRFKRVGLYRYNYSARSCLYQH